MSVWSSIGPLVGVVVGGGITWGTQWGLAMRADGLDAKVAKRQVRAELRRHVATLESARDPEWIDFFVNQVQLAGSGEWEKHSDQLARELSDSNWDAVQAAYQQITGLILATRVLPIEKEQTDPDVVRTRQDGLRWACSYIDEAIKCLR